LILLVVEVLSPCLPVLLSIDDAHVGLSVSSVNGSLATLDSLSVLWNGSGGRRVLEFLSLVWLGLQLQSGSVWGSGLSLEGSGISLVVKVLSPVLPILLSVGHGHVGSSVSSVDSGLASHDSSDDTYSWGRLLELLTLVRFGRELDGGSVRGSGLSLEGSGVFLVVEVLSPSLPVLLTVGHTHISLSVSSVNSGLASLDSDSILGDSNSGWRVLEFFTLVWLGLELNP
jgi:hypothetical protein